MARKVTSSSNRNKRGSTKPVTQGQNPQRSNRQAVSNATVSSGSNGKPPASGARVTNAAQRTSTGSARVTGTPRAALPPGTPRPVRASIGNVSGPASSPKPSGTNANLRPGASRTAPSIPKPTPAKPTAKPPTGAVTPSTPGRMNRAARSLVGTKARAIGAAGSIASSALTGDAKGAAITGGTYAAGRLLQAIPNPGAKIAGKVVEAAAPFTPGLVNALSSGSARPQSRTSNSGSRTKADLIGKVGARTNASILKNASKFETAYNPPGDTRANYGLTKAPPAPKLPAPVTRSSSGGSSTPSRSGTTSRRSSAPSAPAAPAKPGQKWSDFNPNRGTSKTNNPLMKDMVGRMKDREDKAQASSASKLTSKFNTNANFSGEKMDGSMYQDSFKKKKKS